MKRWYAVCALTTFVLSAMAMGVLQMDDEAVDFIGPWTDTEENYINAHGGGILSYDGCYYWYGEHRPERGFSTERGISCYSSFDLHEWKNEGIVLKVSSDESSDIVKGCIMERPKVVYCPKTKKFVMWFHLELKGQGYDAARAAVAVSDSPTGPFEYVSSGRVNPGIYPENMTETEREKKWDVSDLRERTPEWAEAIVEGMYTLRDLEGGQMSRDMTIFVDDDGKAYHVYASEENWTLQIAELTDDYTGHNGRYIRVAPMGQNEAPAMFKHDGTYWLITSGCTGWAPNEARLFSAPSIWGPWTKHPNPCRGEGSERTFGAQSTYVLALPDGKYLFMADEWKPRSLMYSGYLWLPIKFDKDDTPYIEKIW